MVKVKVDIQVCLLINHNVLTACSVPNSGLTSEIQTPETFWSVPEGTNIQSSGDHGEGLWEW